MIFEGKRYHSPHKVLKGTSRQMQHVHHSNRRLTISALPFSQTLASAIIPVGFLLYQYSFASFSLGFILAFASALLCTIISGRLSLHKTFGGFCLVYLARIAINLFLPSTQLTGGVVRQFAQQCAIAFSVLALSGFVNRKQMYKAWKICSAVVMVGLLYHAVQVFILGQKISVIRIFPLPVLSEDLFARTVSRPISVFSEPAVVAQFLLPLLYMALMRQEMKWALLATVSILISTSSSGLVGVALVWGFVLIFRTNRMRNKGLILVILVVFCAAVFFLPMFSPVVDKLLAELEGTSNSYVRMFLGYDLFAQLPLLDKVVGLQYISIAQYRIDGFATITRVNQPISSYSYVNTIQQVLITMGIVGFLVFVRMLWMLYAKQKETIGPYLLMVIVLMFFTKAFFNVLFLFIWLFVLSMLDRNKTDYLTIRLRH